MDTTEGAARVTAARSRKRRAAPPAHPRPQAAPLARRSRSRPHRLAARRHLQAARPDVLLGPVRRLVPGRRRRRRDLVHKHFGDAERDVPARRKGRRAGRSVASGRRPAALSRKNRELENTTQRVQRRPRPGAERADKDCRAESRPACARRQWHCRASAVVAGARVCGSPRRPAIAGPADEGLLALSLQPAPISRNKTHSSSSAAMMTSLASMQGGLDALRVDGFVIFVSRIKVQSSNRAVKIFQ
jgi:hypothetical protein